MKKVEKLLRHLIKEVLLSERGAPKIKKHFKAKRQLSAHLVFMPIISYKGAGEDRGIHKFFEKVKEEIELSEGYQQKYWKFVIEKNKSNIEKLIKLINEEEKDSQIYFVGGLDVDYLRSTLNDDLPILLCAAKGDGSSRESHKVVDVKNDKTVPQWAIHDLYHFNESSDFFRQKREGYADLLRLSNVYFGDKEKKIEALKSVSVDISNINETENEILEFFNSKEDFTVGVDLFDIYPSIFSYIIMNIDNLEDILKLDLSNESKKIFVLMWTYVQKYEEWLLSRVNKNKIFITTADFDVDYSDGLAVR